MKEIFELNYIEIKENLEYEKLIRKVLQECFKEEKLLNSNFYISVTLTNEENIRKINKEYRNIDKATDVLSFPMFEKDEILETINNSIEYVLGDTIICIPIVEKQAIEYGHAFEREFAYMLVHSFYHLLGYDHIEENDKIEMRKKEENILTKLNILR